MKRNLQVELEQLGSTEVRVPPQVAPVPAVPDPVPATPLTPQLLGQYATPLGQSNNF